MVIMHPGACPDTAFPDRYWIDDYWADFSAPPFLRGSANIVNPLINSRTVGGRDGNITIKGLNSSPSINSREGNPDISNTLNNEGSII